MPTNSNELWDKIDQLAKEASETHGENKIAYVLTQVAEIGRTFKRRGIKQLFDAVNFHCANMLGESLANGFEGAKKPTKKRG